MRRGVLFSITITQSPPLPHLSCAPSRPDLTLFCDVLKACMEFCLSKGYKYAATQYSIE